MRTHAVTLAHDLLITPRALCCFKFRVPEHSDYYHSVSTSTSVEPPAPLQPVSRGLSFFRDPGSDPFTTFPSTQHILSIVLLSAESNAGGVFGCALCERDGSRGPCVRCVYCVPCSVACGVIVGYNEIRSVLSASVPVTRLKSE